MAAATGFMSRAFGTKSEISLILFMVLILLVLFTPIPAALLDFLLIANFTVAMMILMLTFYMDKPIAFSTFPSILLIATLFRLSLNVAATRLILGEADAGEVIGAIGSYVVGGNYIIGLVVFLIIIVVQYVVVTSGAQRVAEVAARFTLDSMPGKQMSIDADLNMGLIDEKEAQQRRAEIEREANFYGSMDGASKFVKGDAIAGIIIILIDIIGGLSIGIAQRGMSWGDALHTYTLLTVGDGIVTQIPALIISTATGIIVTRAASDAFFGEELTKQVSRYPKTLVIACLFLFLFMLLPGMPIFPVLSILVVVAVAAVLTFIIAGREEQGDSKADSSTTESADETLYSDIAVEPIEIVVGSQLAQFLGGEQDQFMEKIKTYRKQYAHDIGFVFPSVRLRDDERKPENDYEINIFGAKVAEAEIYPGHLLAISSTLDSSDIPGIKTSDPTYGLPAIWIEEQYRAKAKEQGFTLVDPITVIITHFSEIIRTHAHELLTRQETEQLLARIKEEQPSLYEELVPNTMQLSDIQKVLQNLLSEQVSIRDIVTVLEVLVDKGKSIKSHEELTEFVRQKLGRVICDSLTNKDNELYVLTFDPSLEQLVQNGLKVTENKTALLLDPFTTEKLLVALGEEAEKMMGENIRPVLLCSPSLRRHIKRLTSRSLRHLTVLSLNEVPETISIKSYSIVNIETAKSPDVNKKAG